MTRPNLLVGALAAACVGTLLWCAWLILAADLPLGARVAAWALWLVSTAAVVTLLAYLREFLSHRRAVGRDASWRPLPSLVLLWIGGLTALVSFAFILPGQSSSRGAEGPAKAGTSLTSQTVTPTPASTSAGPGSPRGSATTSGTASRSASRKEAPAGTTSTSAARTTPTPARTSSTASPTPTTSTTTPIIDLDILPTQARPTTPPGR